MNQLKEPLDNINQILFIIIILSFHKMSNKPEDWIKAVIGVFIVGSLAVALYGAQRVQAFINNVTQTIVTGLIVILIVVVIIGAYFFGKYMDWW